MRSSRPTRLWRPLSPPSRPDSPLRRLATVRRGAADESWHSGAIAVVTPAGQRLRSTGDVALPVVVRSTIKPFQALPLLLAGGESAFSLTAADLALICSSHSGTPEHRSRARSLLERAGFTESDLLCGAHRPLGEATARTEEPLGLPWTALHNNCSGKHAGMLLACRLLDLDPVDYIAVDHPLQRAIAAELAGILSLPQSFAACGIDGCSAPTFTLPLAGLARGFALLAASSSAEGAVGLPVGRGAALGRLTGAMASHPDMVAGPERFTSALIAATSGRLVGKEGAEGVYAIAVRAPRPLGIAIKIADGSERCRDVVVLELLDRLELITAGERQSLAAYDRPTLHNHRGLAVGEIAADFELE